MIITRPLTISLCFFDLRFFSSWFSTPFCNIVLAPCASCLRGKATGALLRSTWATENLRKHLRFSHEKKWLWARQRVHVQVEAYPKSLSGIQIDAIKFQTDKHLPRCIICCRQDFVGLLLYFFIKLSIIQLLVCIFSTN